MSTGQVFGTLKYKPYNIIIKMEPETLKKRLLSKYPNLSSVALKEIHESNNNKVFSCWDFIIKVSQDKDNLKNEFEYLRLLEGKWKFPKPISYDIENDDHILIMSKLCWVGLDYLWHEFDENEKNQILKDIVHHVKTIHSINIPSWIEVDYSKIIELNFYKNLQVVLLNPNVTEREVHLIKNEIEKYKSCFNDSSLSLVHNDLWYKNILIEDKKLTGIIDFELGFYWPIELDFFRLLHHKISVINYEDKFPVHYEELDFLDSLMKIIKLDYPQLVKKITSEQIYIYNLQSYFLKLSRHNETWYNHEEVMNFKNKYCKRVALEDLI
ncbi:MAG: hypothetical protein ACD_3C00096G0003 [uncultured bacterium (gcode 4)]|uniref:Aminoglycoside phosphotransferase domain-containing protein n=1 Tax=uncultured bacterium (gcode 4) TaxID=1234023 RepID=K2GXJ3_9BACT|nr:MAG: hypothetical protein ACD_3C00096G0003 [uncultured bacterium (gcode 4)]